MKDVNITLPNVGSELVVRQGEALPLKEPKVLQFSGNLKAPRTYLAHHGNIRIDGGTSDSTNVLPEDPQMVDCDRAIIIVDKQDMSITLHTDYGSAYGHTVTGKLTITEELAKFGINSDKTMNREQFVKLLRFSKRYFSDAEMHAKVLEAYQKFQVKTTQDLATSSDNRGNRTIGYDKQVNSNLPETFALTVPIFKGYDPVKFMVEVCVDVTETQASFWLESVELAEIMETKRDELIDEQLKGIAPAYVVVYK